MEGSKERKKKGKSDEKQQGKGQKELKNKGEREGEKNRKKNCDSRMTMRNISMFIQVLNA